MPQSRQIRLGDAFRNDSGFLMLAESLPDTVLVVDESGCIVYASSHALDLFGRDSSSLEGLSIHDLIHPEDRKALPDRFADLSGGGWDARLADSERWVSLSLLPPELKDHEPLATGDAFLLVRPIDPSEAPRDRAALYRRALDSANSLVVISDPRLPDSPIVFANENFFRSTGYSREEVLGRNCRFLQYRADGTRDEDQPGFDGEPGLETLRHAIARGERTKVVLRNYRKNGEVFYNELYITPVPGPDGGVVAFVGVQNDVTARVLAKNELADRNRLLDAFYETSPLMMGIVELDGSQVVHRSANRAATSFFDVESVEGQRTDELGFPETETMRWSKHFRTSMESGEAVEFETMHPWGSAAGGDKVRALRVVVSPIAGAEDHACAYVMEDRTEAVAVESERKKLHAAVESLPDPVIITDADLDAPGPRIVYVNPAYTEVFGYKPNEVIGKSPRIGQGPATDRAVLRRLRNNLQAGNPARGEAVNYRKNGEPFLVQWEIAPIRDSRNVVTHFVATMRDVTDRRRLERAVFEATTREQERMARDLHDGLGQILAGTRFALSAVAGTLRDQKHSEASTVAVASDRIGQALSQARSIAHGLLPTHLEGRDLATALEELCADVSQSYRVVCAFSGGIDVESQPRSHHLYRIAQEATNNAIRHGGAQTIKVRLSPDTSDSGFAAALTITDDGSGIDPEQTFSDGVGMWSMRFRAQSIGGELQIGASPEGRGARITCLFDPEDTNPEGTADLELAMGLD